MKHKFWPFLFMLIVLTFPLSAFEAITPNEYQAKLGHGMDADWCKTKKGMEQYREFYPRVFRAQGIRHIRLRVMEDLTEELLDHMESVVQDCLDARLIPIIAYQADAFKVKANRTELEKAALWWERVARTFSDYDARLSFDLLIECTDALNKNPALLNDYHEACTAAIRKTNKERIIMISPIVRSAPENLSLLRIPSKANGFLMAEWHLYASGPDKTNPEKKWTTGKREEKQLILNKIKAAQDWQEKTGIPTWVGAWMAGNYNKGNDYTFAEQEVFATFMATALDNAKIPFAVNSDNFFYDGEKYQWIKETDTLRNILYGKEITK